jgi:endonuclease IV
MQLFGGTTKGYWCNNVAINDVNTFRDRVKEAGMYTTVHAVYIINPAADPVNESRHSRMSTHGVTNHLLWANRLGCNSVVLHSGSAKDAPKEDGIGWAIDCLREAFLAYDAKIQDYNAEDDNLVKLDPSDVRLLLENSAGDSRNRKLGGADLSELTKVIAEVGDPRLGLVIDTTHAYAAGYSVDQIISTLQEPSFRKHLDLIHFNQPNPDVRKGSHLDRHASVFTAGAFPLNDLAKLFEAFRDLPLILEGTPHLPSDLVWLLRWELELKNSGSIEKIPISVGPTADDIFTLYQDLPT